MGGKRATHVLLEVVLARERLGAPRHLAREGCAARKGGQVSSGARRSSRAAQLTLRPHMHTPVVPLQMFTPLEGGAAILSGALMHLLNLARGGEELALEFVNGEGATTTND